MLANANFRRLVLITFVTGLCPPLFAKGAVYYGAYVLQQPGTTQTMLTGIAAGQLVTIPLWIWLASRFEKAVILAATHCVAGSALVAIWLLQPTGLSAGVLGGWVGMGLCGAYMLPWSMLPDIVDEVDATTKMRPEAPMFAVAILAMKLGIGLGTLAFGLALAWSGYVAGKVQPFAVHQTITLLTCLFPALGCLLIALLAREYRLSYHLHEQSLATILARRSLEPMNDG